MTVSKVDYPWQFFEYNPDPYNFTEFKAKLVSISDDKDGVKEAVFKVPATRDNFNRFSDYIVVLIFFDDEYAFEGEAIAGKENGGLLTVTCQSRAFRIMQRNTITGVFADSDTETIWEAICEASGIYSDGCPSVPMSVRFDEVDCFTAAKTVLDLLREDNPDNKMFAYLTNDGFYAYITYVGGYRSLPNGTYKIKGYGFDIMQYVSWVKVRGVDESGLAIEGYAGYDSSSGGAVYTEKKVTTKAGLDKIAQAKLTELQRNNPGFQVELPLLYSYGGSSYRATDIEGGDYFYVNSSKLDFSNYYKVQKITLHPSKAILDLGYAAPDMYKALSELRRQSELGIYPIEPEQLTPLAVSPNKLWADYHMFEGEPGDPASVVKDFNICYTPAHDGAATNAWWQQVTTGLVYLDFNGTGYVDCGTGYPIAGTSNFSFGTWFSPWSIPAGEAELMFCNNHFRVCVDSSGHLVFGLANSAGSFYWVNTDEAVQVGGRYFVMCTYDGSTMCIYVNGVLAKSGVEVSGDIYASAIDNVTLGGTRFGVYLYDGAMAEAMLWLRTLSPQEVKELYFFPLNSIA